MSEHSRIDGTIRTLLEDAEELSEIFAEEEELSESEIDIWVYYWPNEMVGAARLEENYRAGEMSAEQEERYLELKAKLREIAPALWEQLNLSVPAEVLEE